MIKLIGVKFQAYKESGQIIKLYKDVEALSDWLALRLRLGLTIPVIAGINLSEFKVEI
nr:hypothetical protein [Nostoc sp. WHI]